LKKKKHYSNEHFHLHYITKFVENLPITKEKTEKKQISPQDGRQMVEMKFDSCKIIPHYYNNIFVLHMHTFTNSVFFLNTFNIAIH